MSTEEKGEAANSHRSDTPLDRLWRKCAEEAEQRAAIIVSAMPNASAENLLSEFEREKKRILQELLQKEGVTL